MDIALSTLMSLETVLRQLGGGAALPTMLPAWTLQRLTAAAARLRENTGPIHVDDAPADVSPHSCVFALSPPTSPPHFFLSPFPCGVVGLQVVDDLAAAVEQLHHLLHGESGVRSAAVCPIAAPPSPVAVL